MNYTAIYEDPWGENGTSEEGTRVTYTVKLHVSSNIEMDQERVKQVLRRYLSDRLKITDIKEEKIRIE
jgi:hypothetical protein